MNWLVCFTVSKGTKYEVEFVDNKKETQKIIIVEDSKQVPIVIDQRPVIKDFIKPMPVVIKEKVDETTNVHTVVYPTLETFKLDESSTEITEYVKKTVTESSEYEIQAVRK